MLRWITLFYMVFFLLIGCNSTEQQNSVAADSSAVCSEEQAVADLSSALEYRQRGYYKEAVPYYQLAADACNQQAQFELAEIYHKGWGVSADYDLAYMLYQQAALQGNITAMTRMGILLDKGLTKEAYNRDQAMRWFRRAAEKNDALAQYHLAEYYRFGRAGVVDIDKANMWFAYSALNGNREAAYNLALRSYKGDGLPKDPAEAYKWMSLAAALDYYDAGKLRDQLAREITLQERQAAWLEVEGVIQRLENVPE